MNKLKTIGSFNPRQQNNAAGESRLKSHRPVYRAVFHRVADYVFGIPPARSDRLTPHLQHDVGLSDIHRFKKGA
jgi:hypothetical protein